MTQLFFQSFCTKKWRKHFQINFWSHFTVEKFSKFFQSLFTVENFRKIFSHFLWLKNFTYSRINFFFFDTKNEKSSHVIMSVGSQIWFKNWFSNAPIFFSCGPIFTSTVSKIFSLDRRIHFGTSWHPQMCHSYLSKTNPTIVKKIENFTKSMV